MGASWDSTDWSWPEEAEGIPLAEPARKSWLERFTDAVMDVLLGKEQPPKWDETEQYRKFREALGREHL